MTPKAEEICPNWALIGYGLLQVAFIFFAAQAYILLVDDAYYYFGIVRHVIESDYHCVRDLKMPTNCLFLVIGANNGVSALSFLNLSTDIAVISFEPNPVHEHALDLIAKRYRNFSYHAVGLGDSDGSAVLYSPKYNHHIFTGLSSIDRENASNWLRDGNLFFFDPNKLDIVSATVQRKRLDSFQLAPFLIKTDVQGHELRVLKGGIQPIKEHLPILLIESAKKGSEIHTFLDELGNEIFGYKQGKFLKSNSDGKNSFFVHSSKQKYLRSIEDGGHSL